MLFAFIPRKAENKVSYWPMKNLIFLSIFFLSLSYVKAKGKVLSKVGLEELEDYAFSPAEKFKTNALVLIKDGSLVYERYARGFSKDDPHILWSASKSVLGVLYGIAVEEKIINLSDKASNYFSKVDKRITIEHLLRMRSGLNWNESYTASPVSSDVVKMLYVGEYKDMARYASSLGQEAKPNLVFNYSSGTSNILSAILKKSMSRKEYESFPWTKLFDPLDIRSATWEKDLSGSFVGSSYLYMSALDFSKIGQLMLNEGKFGGKKLFF